jgi:hypothetical protein
MLNKLAPIILFAYNRPWHTEQVLIALKNNHLAEQSHLIVFVDGYKVTSTLEERQNIEEVRRVVQKEKWCGSVEYYISETNLGCRNSIIAGISKVFVTYEAAIVLEDDIITSPYFLKYMNLTLNYYKERKSVFSISGHNLPESRLQIPNDYAYDVYVSHRLLNWGWGTWSDRWSQTKWDKMDIPAFLGQSQQVKAFNRGGDDLSRMLLEEFEGKSDAWDIQFAYTHFINHAVSIVPCHSYIKNIGLDGTGTHVPKGTLMDNHLSLAVSEPRLLDVIYEDSRIINAFYNAYCEKKRPLWKKTINFIWRKLWMRPPFIIKQKVYCR